MTSYLTNADGQRRAIALMTAAIHEDDRLLELMGEGCLDPAATIEGFMTLLRIELAWHAKVTGSTSSHLLQLYGKVTAIHEYGIEDPPDDWESGPEK